ncbi:MAG: metal-dependent transcriptional regulator [Ignisphaera sp.]|uniref:Metal-dependent transcriptional regulator n=1 Tax=Ignisphaera aggregans TaxID=334771 RepID=A0A7J3MYA1_9CREN
MVVKHFKIQTKTLEDYLKAMYRLEEIYGIAKTQDIATELNVTPATVSKTLKKLAEGDYIRWIPYEGVKLTKKGRRLAEDAIKKHRIAETFLHLHLGFDLIESHRYAHMFEHLPDEILDRLWIYMQKPSRCPHGNPIPGSVTDNISDLPLTEFVEGTEIVITRILCSFDSSLLAKVISLGIEVSKKVCIESTSPMMISLLINGKRVELNRYESRLIRGLAIKKCR